LKGKTIKKVSGKHTLNLEVLPENIIFTHYVYKKYFTLIFL